MKELTAIDIKILSDLLVRIVDCLGIEKFINTTSINFDYDKLIDIKVNNISGDLNNSLLLINNDLTKEEIEFLSKRNTIINLCNDKEDEESFYLNYPSSDIKISIYAKWFDIKEIIVPDTFKVLAIIHVYNEEDIIEQTVKHLLSQGIDVYLLDNWSKDNTPIIIERLKEENPNRVFIEKFPKEQDNNCYDWYHQLEKTEELSKRLDYDWFIHYDVDEYRITPRENITLKQMIYFASSLGFNLIENTLVNFRITDEKETNIFMKDTYFEFGKTSGAAVQYKTWKKDRNIELKSSGGHVAKIDNPKSFPLKILNRHYPFRNVGQADKKIFKDRNPRYRKEELDIGWHIQYKHISNKKDFICDKKDLLSWNKNTTKDYFIKLFILGRDYSDN